MAKKSKVEFTAETLRKAIADGKPASMTQLAHQLGYKGSVSSSLTRKFKESLPDVEAMLNANKPAKDVQDGKADASAAKAVKAAKSKAVKSATTPIAKPKSGKWTRHVSNPFRVGSYGTCFDVLAAHPDGLPREKLIELLAKATGKDIQHAAFDAQVVCSARKNDDGLDQFQGPRNRSCKHGFYVERINGHVKLVLAAASTATKETP